MRPFKRGKNKPVVSEADQQKAVDALARAEAKLETAEELAEQAKPVMHDLRAQREANHFAWDIYRAMLDGK
jgi:hypothetical protein